MCTDEKESQGKGERKRVRKIVIETEREKHAKSQEKHDNLKSVHLSIIHH